MGELEAVEVDIQHLDHILGDILSQEDFVVPVELTHDHVGEIAPDLFLDK